MKRHLTEKELIKYQFNLLSQKQAEEISNHLNGCDNCRQQAQRLKDKFAALDLLSEETIVSEQLISQTVAQAAAGSKTSIFLFRKPVWIGAAAAVLLIGLLLLSELGGYKKQTRQIAADTKLTGESKLENSPAAPQILDKEISDKPPFAPASAIELVTLPRRDNVQITIYNSADMTLVREKRNLTLKKGWNWLQFMWSNTLIDPTSLSIEPQEQADKIDIQQLVFPARLKDIGRWLIKSEVEGQVPFEITYFTSGLSWRAFYMGTLSADEQKMNLQGYVRVTNNSGEDYENSQTRLIVGNVHQLDQIAELAKRQYPHNRPIEPRQAGVPSSSLTYNKDFQENFNGNSLGAGLAFNDRELAGKPKEIIKEGLSEYFLYTIEGTETIPDKWGKRLISFNVNDVNVTSLYKYDQERWGEQTIRFISFANDKKHNLGSTPIPNGDMRIYSQTGQDRHLSYVGGTSVKYIPVDEEVELNLGQARLATVEPELIDFKTANFLFDKKGNVAGWDEIKSWKVEITNASQLPIDVEITRMFGTVYWTLEYSDKDISYEKYDAARARFKAKLAPQSKRMFTYTVTTRHGRREQSLNEIKNEI